jgi:hypothetical protein
MTRLLVSAVSAAASAVLGPSACRRPAADAPRADFTITATEYRLALPAAVAAGWRTVRFRSAGREFNHAVFLRVRDATAADSALAALAGWSRDWDHPVPGATSAGGVEGAEPLAPRRAEAPGRAPDTYGVVALEPGYYLVVCMIRDATGALHVNRGMHGLLRVLARGGRGAGADTPPVADLTVRAGDYAYRLSSAAVAPGWHLVAVENAGPAEHVTEIARLRAGSHLADVFRPRAGAPDPIETVVGGAPRLAVGARSYAWVRLERGRYVVYCPLRAADGRSHVEHGMAAEITVRPSAAVSTLAPRAQRGVEADAGALGSSRMHTSNPAPSQLNEGVSRTNAFLTTIFHPMTNASSR